MSLILDLFFPCHCYYCHQPGHYFCSNCQSQLVVNSTHPPDNRFEGRLSLFKYHSALKLAIIDLKYHFVTDVISDLAHLASKKIFQNFPHLLNYWQQNHYVIFPVPLHTFRQNWRGFNQSSLMASALATNLSLPFATDLATRCVNVSPQASLHHRRERLGRLHHAFLLNPKVSPPSHLIIFDDVYTSGDTVKSLAAIFPQSTKIWILTLAG